MQSRFFMCLVLFFQTAVISAASDDSVSESSRLYRFGVFPYFSEAEMQAIYRPVAKALAERSGLDIEFSTESSHKKFIHRLNNEYYDFALIPPFWYPVAVDEKNYIPLLKMVEPFTSLVLVLDDSPALDVNDLRGKTIATPPAFTPVVYLAIKALSSQGIVPGRDVTLKAQKTVDACFQLLLNQQAQACVSPPFAPAYFEQRRNVRFRALLKSDGIPGVALVAHSRLEERIRQQIQDGFMAWPESQEGQDLLSRMQIRRFVPIMEGDYTEVRALLKQTRPMH